MAYQKLTIERLTTELPLILAGPVLRNVTKTSVTVWLALQQGRDIKLTVRDSANTRTVAEGSAHSWQIGEHLHLAAVTAAGIFADGATYLYDLDFSPSTLASPRIFSQKGGVEPLCYPPHPLPSFTVPPDDYKQLRFLHGSCRMLHAEGHDASPGLDHAIKRAVDKKETRPHLLMLTGDQIYADNVSASILRIVMDVGAVLFGRRGQYMETLPIKDEAVSVRPRRRLAVARQCHFTSELDAMENHLLYFAEYCCMYLMMWSDVFWPAKLDDYPTYEQTYEEKPGSRGERRYQQQQRDPCLEAQKAQPALRRALANIPVYMIMDDHEVADDAFITANWCANVLTNTVGRQVVQNALKAYALFQAWGNTPEQFTDPAGPGRKLLELVKTGAGVTGVGSTRAKEIDRCLGIPPVNRIFDDTDNKRFWGKDATGTEEHDLSPLMAPRVTYDGDGITLYKYADEEREGAPPVCLRWDYVLRGTNYQFVVNDTRTWRAYPGNDVDAEAQQHGNYPCVPISREGIRRQVIVGAALGGSVDDNFVTFVVNGLAPYDVPTLEWFRKRNRLWLREAARPRDAGDVFTYDIEGWAGHPSAMERFFALWATRELPALSPTRRRVVILSGDIHHSYTTCIRYYAAKPMDYKGDPITPPRECAAVFACFTASGFKKEDAHTRKLHSFGYDAGELLNKRDLLFYFGWARKPDAPVELGELTARAGGRQVTDEPVYKPLTTQIKGKYQYPNVMCLEELCLELRSPALILYQYPQYMLKLPSGNEVSDWRYHLQYLDATTREALTVSPLPPMGKRAIAAACQEFRRCALAYGPATGPGRQVVGLNNFGDLSFGTSGSSLFIVEAVWWNRTDAGRTVLADHSHYTVPFDPVKFNVVKQ